MHSLGGFVGTMLGKTRHYTHRLGALFHYGLCCYNPVHEVRMMTENARHRARPQLRRAIVIVLSVMLSALSLGIVAPAQAAAPEKQEVGSYVCLWYTVRRGDTLSEIGAKYGVTVITLRRVNGLKTTRIYTGQKLCIPRNKPAPPNPPPPSGGGAWYAEYWNNTTQTGPAALVRNDAAINFNWGFGSPDLSRVQPDFFSARWTRNINFAQGGVYRFSFNVDDGVRLTINNQVVLDNFNFVGPQQPSVDVPVAAGLNRITVDYAEQQGLAYIQFSYNLVGPVPPPCQPGVNCPFPPDNAKFNNGPWTASYFANPDFAGAPSFVRTECCLRFDWRGGSPAPGIPGAFWTARFQQTRYFPAGVYQFVARVDDGVRIYLDGQLIMNEFRQQSTRTFTADANLGAGNHTIVVEYVQYGGTSDLSLYWDFLGDPNAPVRPISPAVLYFPGQP